MNEEFTPQAYEPEMPMKWFKFLIYFALFAGPILNIISGVRALTGSQYGDDADLVYRVLPGMETLDKFYGIMLILVAIFGLVTRFMLAGFKKSGPPMLYVMYALNVLILLIYTFGTKSVISHSTTTVDLSSATASAIGSAVFSVVMIALNVVYFNKRKHLFVN